MRIQGDNFGKELTFKHQLHEKIYTYPTHIHQFAELIFMLDGELTITVDGKSEKLTPGDAALVLPFQTHKFYSRSVIKSAMYLFSPSMTPSFFESLDGKVGSCAVFKPSEATKQHFENKIKNEADLSLYSVKAFLYLAFSDFLASNELRESIDDTPVASKVATYMNEHYAEPITLTSVATAIGYSPNYLSHCIKSTFNLNFCSLLASLRVDKARFLLAETGKNCIEICYECGFGSERSFHRQFKSVTGKTPSDYRESYACSGIRRPKVVFF